MHEHELERVHEMSAGVGDLERSLVSSLAKVRSMHQNTKILAERLKTVCTQRDSVSTELQLAEAELKQWHEGMREAERIVAESVVPQDSDIDSRAELERALAARVEAAVRERGRDLEQVQAKLAKAKQDLALWNRTYSLQKLLSQKLEWVQCELKTVMFKRWKVEEAEFEAVVAALSDHFDHLHIMKVRKRRRRAAAQGN